MFLRCMHGIGIDLAYHFLGIYGPYGRYDALRRSGFEVRDELVGFGRAQRIFRQRVGDLSNRVPVLQRDRQLQTDGARGARKRRRKETELRHAAL